jgi:hypothetical protein
MALYPRRQNSSYWDMTEQLNKRCHLLIRIGTLNTLLCHQIIEPFCTKNKHATMELLETVSSVRSNPKLYNEDPRKIALARISSIYKWQTRPLVREGAPQKQDRNCQTKINLWSWAPAGARHQDLLIDRPSIAMYLWLWLWRQLGACRTEYSVLLVTLTGAHQTANCTWLSQFLTCMAI